MKAYSPKALATREKILEAANGLFYDHGFNATGVDRIIAAAGVTKGNFFYHFKSKEELATAVLDWHRERAFAEIGLEELLAGSSPLQTLLALVGRMTERMFCGTDACRIRGCFFGNFALELAGGSEPVRHKVEAVFDGVRDLLRQLIERGQAQGEIRAELDPDKTAGLILSLMEGAVLLDKTHQQRCEVPDALEFVSHYLAA